MPARIRTHIAYAPRVVPKPTPVPLPPLTLPATDCERLRRLWPEFSIKQISAMMHKSPRTISRHAKTLGLTRHRTAAVTTGHDAPCTTTTPIPPSET